MKNLKNRIFQLVILGAIFSTVAYAQGLPRGGAVLSPSVVEAGTETDARSPDRLWTDGGGGIRSNASRLNVRVLNGRQSVLDLDRVAEILAKAPLRQNTQARRPSPTYIYLPAPDGGFAQFAITRTEIMSAEMAAENPDITTYRGVAVNDPSTIAVLDLTPEGFHAQVLQPGKRWFVDPQYRNNNRNYVSYFKATKNETRQCLLETPTRRNTLQSPHVFSNRSGEQLREYALAIATTGEYGAFFGGVAPATAAVVTTINRVVGIYEKELGITFSLNALVYDNPATDPFNGNNSASVLINESQTVLDANIGSGNYDIGHTFSTGAGGLASLGVVCNTSFKGRGVTGLPNPTGDVFDVDFVSHEIGHQFGGNHTFNGALGSCAGFNRNGSTAFEPGSGTTIQAYAGICGADNVQSNSDAIMHAISHSEMINHVTNGSGAGCGIVTSTGNSVPTVNAQADYAIPHSTPFLLVGSGADADGDTVTYLWEQFDLGPQAALSAADDGQIPLFRVRTPVFSPGRFFPEFSTVEANVSDVTEKLPAVGRTMDMRLTARDGLGGVEKDDMQVTVDGSAGPFLVTSPNGGETVSGNTTITWDVANTDGGLVSASNVNIYVSTIGSGFSYTPLLLNTPNDGSETVDLTGYDSATARIMVSDNTFGSHTFYDISDSTFVIGVPLGLTCAGQPVDVDLNLGQTPTSGPDVIYGTPAGETINGLGGDDIICGGDGYDIIYGGAGSDQIFGGDSLQNDSSFNDLYGGTGNDFLYGASGGNDFLFGQSGADQLVTYSVGGQDKLFGGSGNDTLESFSVDGSEMRGQGNNDTIYGSEAADVILGDPGLDTIYGNGGNDNINGGKGRDVIYGGAGDDSLTGAGQRDTLFGEDGDDTLLGGLGNDALDGGDHIVGDVCNGQGQEAIGAGDTEANCETSTGFPRVATQIAEVEVVNQPGRRVLTDTELRLIDRCNLTIEECLANRKVAVR